MFSANSTRALVVGAAIVSLAGCSSGLQSAPAGGPALQNHARAMAQIQRAMHDISPFTVRKDVFAKIGQLGGVNPKFPRVTNPDKTKKPSKWKPSVFVADYEGGASYTGALYQFSPISKKATVIGTITDSINPQGLDADSHENLYVAATGSLSVNVYAPNTYTATSTLSDSGGYPVSVGVAPDGTTYAANIFNSSFGPGNIEIYAPGATSPTGTVPDSNIDSARFLAVDGSGTLWYDYLDDSGYTGVASYAPGTGTVTEYGSLGIGFPGGVRITKDNYLVISDQYVGAEFFHNPPQQGDPFLTVSCGAGDPVSFSFNKTDKDVFISDASNAQIEVCSAAKGKLLYDFGSGSLVLPIDAYVIPAGNT